MEGTRGSVEDEGGGDPKRDDVCPLLARVLYVAEQDHLAASNFVAVTAEPA